MQVVTVGAIAGSLPGYGRPGVRMFIGASWKSQDRVSQFCKRGGVQLSEGVSATGTGSAGLLRFLLPFESHKGSRPSAVFVTVNFGRGGNIPSRPERAQSMPRNLTRKVEALWAWRANEIRWTSVN